MIPLDTVQIGGDELDSVAEGPVTETSLAGMVVVLQSPPDQGGTHGSASW